MHLPPDSYFNCLLYQTGALVGFLKLEGLPLSHIKPHGQAYVMAARDVDLARQIAKLAKMYGVPMLGMPGTAHQEACELEGAEFIPEWRVLPSLVLRRCRTSLSRCSSGALTLAVVQVRRRAVQRRGQPPRAPLGRAARSSDSRRCVQAGASRSLPLSPLLVG